MADEFVTTETVVREWDAHGNLVSEVSTLVQTRTPEDPAKPPFGFQTTNRESRIEKNDG